MATQNDASKSHLEPAKYKATFDRLIYQNPDSGYSVVVLKTADIGVPPWARLSHYHGAGVYCFKAVGYGFPHKSGVELLLDGTWESGQHGYQLKVSHWQEVVPHTVEEVRRYLACGLIKGIGPSTADSIVQRFGANALEVIEREPEQLLQIAGITEKKLEDIKSTYQESRDLQELMLFLAPFDVSPKTALSIQKVFGPRSARIIKAEPFSLCKIPNFGFKRVDAIARKTGCKLDAPLRIRGALFYTLQSAQAEHGHLCLEVDKLNAQALLLLNTGVVPHMQLSPRAVSDSLYQLIMKQEVIMSEGNIYLPKTFYQEERVAKKVAQLVAKPCAQIDIKPIMAKVLDSIGVTLSPKQSLAVQMAFQKDLSIITGSPGTGKTTVLKALVEVYRIVYPDGNILLCAPTGRASRRMAESTGVADACTLHSALGLVGSDDDGYLRQSSNKVAAADVVITDEFSMADMALADEFFSQISETAKIVLVGDPDQLPSVGPGNVFREFIACGQIPVTVLTEIFRQKQGSLIAHNAQRINQGQFSLMFGPEFAFVDCPDQEQAATQLQLLYAHYAHQEGIGSVQILSPYKTDGDASANKLNEAIQAKVNPPAEDKPEVRLGSRVFRLGDRVMETKNRKDKNVSNGDVGIIRAIAAVDGTRPVVTIEYPGTGAVQYSAEALGSIELAYATTVHKAMGSEYGTVLIPVLMSHAILLYRNLLYTAATRAKVRVILVGQKKALYMTIKKTDTDKRNTLLAMRIQKYLQTSVLAAS